MRLKVIRESDVRYVIKLDSYEKALSVLVKMRGCLNSNNFLEQEGNVAFLKKYLFKAQQKKPKAIVDLKKND